MGSVRANGQHDPDPAAQIDEHASITQSEPSRSRIIRVRFRYLVEGREKV